MLLDFQFTSFPHVGDAYLLCMTAAVLRGVTASGKSMHKHNKHTHLNPLLHCIQFVFVVTDLEYTSVWGWLPLQHKAECHSIKGRNSRGM